MNQRGKIRGDPQERGDNGHTATKSKNQPSPQLAERAEPVTHCRPCQSHTATLVSRRLPLPRASNPSRADRASPQHLMPTPSTLHLMRPQLAESPSPVTLPDALPCHSFLTQNRLFPWARHFVHFFTICRTRY